MSNSLVETVIACSVIVILIVSGCSPEEESKRRWQFQIDCADGDLAGCEAACKAGVLGSNGCYSAGRMHGEGMGVLKNERRAAFFFSQACGGKDAFRPSAPACLAAALLYRDGSGVEPNHGRALELFKRGCELKNPVACEAVAETLETDGQVHEDRAEFDAAKAAYITACQIRIPPLSDCERAKNIDVLVLKKYKPLPPDL